jgi:hypothetical protein
MKQAKILLYGLACVGKSFSLATLFKLLKWYPDMRVIYLMTERNAMSGLERGLTHHKIELKENQLIYCVVRPKSKKAFKNEANALKKYVSQSAADAQKADASNMNKDKYTYFNDVINGLDSFKGIDYITKEEITIGNVGDLDYTDILVIDGLSPITHGIWNIVKGDRVGGQQNDYQVVQYWIKQFTTNLIEIDCSVILLAHADKIMDDIEKIEKMRVSLDAGVALAGKYAGNWGDVVYAYVNAAGKRLWAGKKMGVEAAARNYPEEDNLEQDFSLYNFFRNDGRN